jgi:hypothetical protein
MLPPFDNRTFSSLIFDDEDSLVNTVVILQQVSVQQEI